MQREIEKQQRQNQQLQEDLKTLENEFLIYKADQKEKTDRIFDLNHELEK